MSAAIGTKSGRAIHGAISPTVLVALMAGCQIVAWTLAPSLTHSSPPLDVVEGYIRRLAPPMCWRTSRAAPMS